MSPCHLVTLSARWIFPVSGPPLDRGTVTVRGDRIESVDTHGDRTPDLDLGDVAVIPGLVNAHTHLDLSGARGLIPTTDPDHFCDWLRGVIAFRRSRTPEQTQADIRAGLAECLRAGTTLVGDITSEGASWDALAGAATRAVVFWELIGLNREKLDSDWRRYVMSTDPLLEGFPKDVAEKPSTRTCWWGYSPHAPYSVNAEIAKFLLWLPNRVTVHVAESPAESELLEQRTGPFVEFLTRLGVYDPSALAGSIADFLTPYQHPFWKRPATVLLVHCNYLPSDYAFAPNQSVVYCPRTHAAFGHPPHPFRDFLARGVRVCLGTDSLASNPDLDILAEARFVHARYPDFPGSELLNMITLAGAEALGWSDETGSLTPGKSADLVAVPLPNRDGQDPHELLFAADAPSTTRRTMFRGIWRN